jgi:four helix bundle protein
MIQKQSIVSEKAFSFALKIIKLYIHMQSRNEYVISKQLVRSGTSIGANVEEALAAISTREFLAKMSIASKEARETHYWLRLIQASPDLPFDLEGLIPDSEELIRMLTAIVKTGQSKLDLNNKKN